MKNMNLLIKIVCALAIAAPAFANQGSETLAKAFKNLRLHKFKNAVDEFTTVLSHDPKNIAGLIGRSVAHYSLQQDEEACQDASAALFIDENNVHMQFVFLDALLHQNKFEEIIMYTTNRIEKNGSWRDYIDRAQAYEVSGKWKEAVSDCDQAIRLGHLKPTAPAYGIREFCETALREGRKPSRGDLSGGLRSNLCDQLDYDTKNNVVFSTLSPPLDPTR